MQTIIASVDFSEASLHAAKYAADMAINLGAELALLHVLLLPETFETPVSEIDYYRNLQDAKGRLNALKEELFLRSGSELKISAAVTAGDLAAEIMDICAHKAPFAVVIGTEREHYFDRFFFGSNTFNILKKMHYPVLVVPQTAVFRRIRRVTLAVDTNGIYKVPVETVTSLAGMFNAVLDIVHIAKSNEDEQQNSLALQLLQNRFTLLAPQVNYIGHGDVATRLNKYVQENHEDLLVIVGRQHSFFDSLVHKGHARQIVASPAIPVLMLSA